MADRSISVALRAQVAGLVNGMQTAGRSVSQFGDEMNRLGRESPQKLHDIEMAAGGIGVALLGAAGYAVHAGMEFDKQMSAVSAATHASAGEMKQLRAAALEAGAATVFSATDAAEAQTELAKAGLSTAQILGGGLKGALDLAAAGQLGVGEAAETAATAMTQFGLSGRDIPHIADLLAAGAGKAQGEVHDMGEALKQSGLVANQFGVSIEETTGTLAAFASAGLIGSDAGTSLKTMLLQLANPSKESATLMRELGIKAYDATGKFVGLKDLAEQLKTKMGGLTQAQRDQALAQIFGSDAIRAANVLYQQGAGGIEDWTGKVDASGFAIDTAAAKTDNLSGDLERLKGSLETLAISSGSGVSGGLRALTQWADGAVGAFAALPEPIQTTGTVLAGLGGAALVGTAGLLKVRETVNDALDALKDMGPSGERAAGHLGRVTGALGKVAVGAVAAEAAIVLVGVAWRALVDQNPAMKAEELAKALERVGQGETFALLGKSVKEFDLDLQTLTNNTMDNFSHRISAMVEGAAGVGDLDGTFTKARADIGKLDEVLASMATKGNADAAAAAFARIADEAKRQGVSIDELKAGFPQYAAALDGATASEQASIAVTEGHSNAVRTMAGSLQDAIDRTGSLKAAFDEMNGIQINLTQAQINAEAAVDKLSEALDKSKGSLDLNTEAGRGAAQAGIDMAGAAAEVAQKTFDQTGSVEQASGVFGVYRQKLIDNIATQGGTQKATDGSRAAAKLLADQIMQMPAFKAIPITVTGVDAATEKVVGLATRLSGLQDRTIRVTTIQNTQTGETRTQTSAGPRFNRWGGLYQHAAVGALRDAGIFSAVGSGARYAFAEPQTKGEAFIPKSGDLERSRAIWGYVGANWLGMRPGGGGGGGTVVNNSTINVNVTAGMGADGRQIGQQIADALRPYVQRNGGNVQMAIAGRA